jgi:hypothetical protein
METMRVTLMFLGANAQREAHLEFLIGQVCSGKIGAKNQTFIMIIDQPPLKFPMLTKKIGILDTRSSNKISKHIFFPGKTLFLCIGFLWKMTMF